MKWPNDVWVNRKKLAGILTDSSITGPSVLVMVGVGVRTNHILALRLPAKANEERMTLKTFSRRKKTPSFLEIV